MSADQQIKLQLNSKALAALFPEGSAARVELQNAVVCEFVRRHMREEAFGQYVAAAISEAATRIDTRVTSEIAAALKEEVRRIGINVEYNGWDRSQPSHVSLSKDIKGAIVDQVKNQVRETIDTAVKAIMDPNTIQTLVNQAVKARTDAEITNAVRAKVEGALRII